MTKAALCIAITLAACSRTAERITFIDDDYARAHADAVARGLPIFIEITAPW